MAEQATPLHIFALGPPEVRQGVCFMNDSGYNLQNMVKPMQILDSLNQGQQPSEFFSSHLDRDNRIHPVQRDNQNIAQCP